MQAMADLVGRLDVSGRRIGVVSAPGDRRDEDIRAIARIAAEAFDFIILRRDDDARGRGPQEVPQLLAEELALAGFPKEQVEIVIDEREATEAALRAAKPGDLVLLFADNISRTWKQVIYFKPEWLERVASPAPAASPRTASSCSSAPTTSATSC